MHGLSFRLKSLLRFTDTPGWAFLSKRTYKYVLKIQVGFVP